jgi:NCAIR mutase (PurE)-related protein|tara:strand:+ start:1938 stop:2603 length:666 start_codon:yes stop_codon:yes gene_type:complete
MTDRDHTPDGTRSQRIGIDEAVLCADKPIENLKRILDDAHTTDRRLLLTRLSQEKMAALSELHRQNIDYEAVSRTGWYGETADTPEQAPQVAVVTAGTSDVPVAREAVRTLAFSGVACTEVYDVGVAGLWRLLDRVEELSRYPVVIAAAGMDAALPSVLGGLVPGLIIAVPTSVGYGVAAGGLSALNTLLASCAPGIAVVNIDNGYGAACAALRALRSRTL